MGKITKALKDMVSTKSRMMEDMNVATEKAAAATDNQAEKKVALV